MSIGNVSKSLEKMQLYNNNYLSLSKLEQKKSKTNNFKMFDPEKIRFRYIYFDALNRIRMFKLSIISQFFYR